MSGHDLVFYVLSCVAVAAALASAIRTDLSKASAAALVGGAAVAGLLGLAAAPVAAVLAGSCVVLGYAAIRRGQDQEAALDDAATRARRLRTAALVAAFFIIAARSVLIVGWPLAEAPPGAAGPGLPPVALAHYLVVALVLVATGFFGAISRRTVAGVALGLASASAGAVLSLASVSRFVGRSGEAAHLAALVVVFSAGAGALTVRAASGCGDFVRSSDAAWKVAGSLSAVLAGVTFALLVAAW